MALVTKKKKVSFKVYPSSIYGDKFKNVIVRSEVDLDDANRLQHDAMAAFVTAKPFLPVEAVMDPTAESYYIIEFENGEEVVIGASWIKPDTIQYHDGTVAVVTIDNAGWQDTDNIKAGLASRGLKVTNIEILNK